MESIYWGIQIHWIMACLSFITSTIVAWVGHRDNDHTMIKIGRFGIATSFIWEVWGPLIFVLGIYLLLKKKGNSNAPKEGRCTMRHTKHEMAMVITNTIFPRLEFDTRPKKNWYDILMRKPINELVYLFSMANGLHIRNK